MVHAIHRSFTAFPQRQTALLPGKKSLTSKIFTFPRKVSSAFVHRCVRENQIRVSQRKIERSPFSRKALLLQLNSHVVLALAVLALASFKGPFQGAFEDPPPERIASSIVPVTCRNINRYMRFKNENCLVAQPKFRYNSSVIQTQFWCWFSLADLPRRHLTLVRARLIFFAFAPERIEKRIVQSA